MFCSCLACYGEIDFSKSVLLLVCMAACRMSVTSVFACPTCGKLHWADGLSVNVLVNGLGWVDLYLEDNKIVYLDQTGASIAWAA